MREELKNDEQDKINQDLLEAAEKGNFEICQDLIKKGADPNIQDEWGNTTLHYAAKNGNMELFQALINKGANPNIIGKWKSTSLHYAAENDNIAICFKLLEIIEDVNLQDSDEMTALHYAARNANMELFQALINKGANPNIRDGWKNTSLHYAAGNNHTAMCLKLLEIIDIEDVNLQDDDEMTALHYAVKNKNFELCGALIEKEADPNVRDRLQRNSLHYASENDDTAICFKLLENIEDVNLQDKYEKTALHYAVKNKNFELCGALINKGANPNIIDRLKSTALHYAAESDDIAICFKLLENMTIEAVNLQDDDEMTALHYAARNANMELFQALINKGANPNIIGKWKSTALHYAADKNHTAICLKLLEIIEDVNLQDNDEKTALHYAVENNNIEFVIILISEGAIIFDDLIDLISADIRVAASHIYQAKLAKEKSLIEEITQQVNEHLTDKLPVTLVGDALTDIFAAIKKEIRSGYCDVDKIENLYKILVPHLEDIESDDGLTTGKFTHFFRKNLQDFTEWSINLRMFYSLGLHLDNFKEGNVKLEAAKPRAVLANIFAAIKEEIRGGYCDVDKIENLYIILGSYRKDIANNNLVVTRQFKRDFRKNLLDFTEWSINLRMSYMIGSHLDNFQEGQAGIPGAVMSHASSFLPISDLRSLGQVSPRAGYQKTTGELRRYGRNLLKGVAQGEVIVSDQFLDNVIRSIGERKYHFRQEFFAGFNEAARKDFLIKLGSISDYAAEYRETASDRDEQSKQNDLGKICRIKLMQARQIIKKHYGLAIEDDYNIEPEEALKMINGFGQEFSQERNALQEKREDLSEQEVLGEVAQYMLNSIILIGNTIPRENQLVAEEKEDSIRDRMIDAINREKPYSSKESPDF